MFKGKFSKLCALVLIFGILFSVCPVSYATTAESNSIQQVYDKDANVKQEIQHDEQLVSSEGIDRRHDVENSETKPARDYTPEIQLATAMTAWAVAGTAWAVAGVIMLKTGEYVLNRCCC